MDDPLLPGGTQNTSSRRFPETAVVLRLQVTAFNQLESNLQLVSKWLCEEVTEDGIGHLGLFAGSVVGFYSRLLDCLGQGVNAQQ